MLRSPIASGAGPEAVASGAGSDAVASGAGPEAVTSGAGPRSRPVEGAAGPRSRRSGAGPDAVRSGAGPEPCASGTAAASGIALGGLPARGPPPWPKPERRPEAVPRPARRAFRAAPRCPGRAEPGPAESGPAADRIRTRRDRIGRRSLAGREGGLRSFAPRHGFAGEVGLYGRAARRVLPLPVAGGLAAERQPRNLALRRCRLLSRRRLPTRPFENLGVLVLLDDLHNDPQAGGEDQKPAGPSREVQGLEEGPAIHVPSSSGSV